MKTKAMLIAGVAVVSVGALVQPAGAWAVTSASIGDAYEHLDESMDEWDSAPNLRLPSSYHAGFLDFWDNSVTYDDALVIIAYATRSSSDPLASSSLARARVMGDAFLQMQANDPIADGRFRNAYGPEDLFDSSGIPNIQTWGSAMGNNAWAGMALAQLAYATSDPDYLAGAQAVGDWIIDHTYDTRGDGGFTGGYNSNGTKIMWKSSEHNIDAIGLFGMLNTLDPDVKWADAKAHARGFLDSMWVPLEGRFAIGSKADGVSVNNDEYIPEDVQSWGYLATQASGYVGGLDWNIANLQVTDTTNPLVPITGVRFALQTNPAQLSHNDNTAWLEGTAHMALALTCSGTTPHLATAASYLSNIETAQASGPNADGKGIQANSSVGYAGGDDTNYTSLHIGATAWYLMAAQGTNPFQLGVSC